VVCAVVSLDELGPHGFSNGLVESAAEPPAPRKEWLRRYAIGPHAVGSMNTQKRSMYAILHLATGRSHLKSYLVAADSDDEPIKDGYSSVLYDHGDRYSVRVKHLEQVEITAVVDVERARLQATLPTLTCEICEKPAVLFCPSDSAHLCAEHDQELHSRSKLLSRHKRVPITESPFQFGYCADHPGERYDSFCITCHQFICPHCRLFGSHSSEVTREHELRPTGELHTEALSRTVAGDKHANERNGLLENLSIKHEMLTAIQVNYEEVMRLLDEQVQKLVVRIEEEQTESAHSLTSAQKVAYQTGLYFERFRSFQVCLEATQPTADYLSSVAKHDKAINLVLQHMKAVP
jgi:hypothetical protein